MQVSDDRFQAESGWNCFAEQFHPGWLFKNKHYTKQSQDGTACSSILTLLGSCHQKPA